MRQPNLPWHGYTPAPLDPPETVDDSNCSPLPGEPPPEIQRLCEGFRHSGWQKTRQKIYDAMKTIPVPFARSTSFAACGDSLWCLRHKTEPERFKCVPDHCHDRFCVPCGLHRQALIRRNLAQHLEDHPHRFITLTIRSTTEPLKFLVKHLYDSFRRLRSRRLWKAHVFGGAAFLEITRNLESGAWHPHLHIICSGRYLDLQDLKQAWLGVTGDSHAIQINLIRDKRAIVEYVTKYATIPLPECVIASEPDLIEAIQALRGTRMILPFGTWRGWKLLDDPSDDAWALFEHWNAVQINAREGDHL